jgi:hypothetical protein
MPPQRLQVIPLDVFVQAVRPTQQEGRHVRKWRKCTSRSTKLAREQGTPAPQHHQRPAVGTAQDGTGATARQARAPYTTAPLRRAVGSDLWRTQQQRKFAQDQAHYEQVYYARRYLASLRRQPVEPAQEQARHEDVQFVQGYLDAVRRQPVEPALVVRQPVAQSVLGTIPMWVWCAGFASCNSS